MRQLNCPYPCRDCGRRLMYAFDGEPEGGVSEFVFACPDHPQQTVAYLATRRWQDERPGRGEPENYRLPACLVKQMDERRRDLAGEMRINARLNTLIDPILQTFRAGLIEDVATTADRFLRETAADASISKEEAFDGYLNVREIPPTPGALFNPVAHLSADRNRRLADALIHRRWLEAEVMLGVPPVIVYRVYCRRLMEALRGTWM